MPGIIFYLFYKESIAGNIYFFYNDEDATIISLDIEKQYRGMGLGKYLLLNMYNYVRERYIKKILLDDCSDNFRCVNNIYLKVGAKYIEKTGPEMIWMIKNPKRIKPNKDCKIIIKII